MSAARSLDAAEGVAAYIGLGSNLDSPVEQVRLAMAELESLPSTIDIRCSSLYSNPPMGPADQPDYVNAVVVLRTRLDADALLDELQRIERQHGRVRETDRWGPRTLDLDLLLYAHCRIKTPRLTVPHPGLAQRCFVLVPLSELDPGLDVPGHGPLSALLSKVEQTGLARLD